MNAKTSNKTNESQNLAIDCFNLKEESYRLPENSVGSFVDNQALKDDEKRPKKIFISYYLLRCHISNQTHLSDLQLR